MLVTYVVIITSKLPSVCYLCNSALSFPFYGSLEKAKKVTQVYTVGYDTSFHREIVSEKVLDLIYYSFLRVLGKIIKNGLHVFPLSLLLEC